MHRIHTASTAVIVVLAATLVGCGGSTETVTVAASNPDSTTEASSETRLAAKVKLPTAQDDSAASGGIKIRVLDVRTSDALSYDRELLSQGEPATKRHKGGHYVSVKTQLTNDTKSGIDVTCGWPVEVKLLDEDQREFDPDDQLYYVSGNPGCNDKLQPGFSTTVTWPFLLPDGAKAVGFSFRDASDQDIEPAVIPVRSNH